MSLIRPESLLWEGEKKTSRAADLKPLILCYSMQFKPIQCLCLLYCMRHYALNLFPFPSQCKYRSLPTSKVLSQSLQAAPCPGLLCSSWTISTREKTSHSVKLLQPDNDIACEAPRDCAAFTLPTGGINPTRR